ncbi:hypothetical protein [Asticcacaulis machinosus]|uniref:Uncharacterized protein n=1 Tax=Asticcacaulis machinosus TaxID=2984211 RepID=A0ABT5HKR3_9CAUL|nr:hypothetical protein [Asticcacaulis machinosus]MDC7676720.1 hypothetical protein [Asticcacaulis machinosus]
MSIRLYDSAWVRVEGSDQPLQARKDRQNPAIFHVGDHRYDVDATASKTSEGAPKILGILSLQAMREAGIRPDYNSDLSH